MVYAGDLKPKEAWDLLKTDSAAILIDVRTRPEWAFVGIPDLESLQKQPILLSWQVYPSMEVNADFAGQVKKMAPTPDTPLLFLCRSGARSRAAAETMTAVGYKRCYNVADGFEGAPDGERHRGRVGGWKATGLPWIQE
jgi:rhodanese-related sulfurtransferase